MTDLNEKLKLVAEYDGYEVGYLNGDIPAFKIHSASNYVAVGARLFYNTSYNRQIPVWQNVCKEFLDMKNQYTDDIRQFMLFKEKYCKHICYGTPLESFEILVQAIQFINKMKK